RISRSGPSCRAVRNGRTASSTTSSGRRSTRSGSPTTPPSPTGAAAGAPPPDARVGVEDRSLVESVQRGIGSGALEAGTLMPESEKLIAHFQTLVVEALG